MKTERAMSLIRFLLLVASFACAAVTKAQQADSAKAQAQIKTEFTPPSEIWVGQKLTMTVELWAPGIFDGVPTTKLPSIAGLLLIPPAGHPVLSTEEKNGVSYTVQQYELPLFAQRAGDFEVPAFEVTFQFKASPLDKTSVSQTVKTTPVKFSAKMPPGAEKLATLISASSLKVEETWKPEPGKTKAKVGDAFTRTLVFTADDVPGMAFPPFDAGKIEGLGIYPKTPVVSDKDERGTMQGERREVISYVCETAGHFTIPALRLSWWNTGKKSLETINLPERTFDVSGGSILPSAAGGQPFSRAVLPWLGALGALAGLFWLWLLGRRRGWWHVPAALKPVHLVPLNPHE